MKNVTNDKVVEHWSLQLKAQSKSMYTDGVVLYVNGEPVARHYRGIVLISAFDENERCNFNPSLISKQIGLPIEEVLSLRKKVLGSRSDMEDFWWTFAPSVHSVTNYATKQNLLYYIVPNCIDDVSQGTIDAIIAQAGKRLAKSLRCTCHYRISWITGIDLSPYNAHYGELSAMRLINRAASLATLFGLDSSSTASLNVMMKQAEDRYIMCQYGGPSAIKKFIKEHQLSKHTPVEEIVALMQRPEFEKIPHEGKYKHDIMIRQMAASEVRAKYGAKGDRKKRV